MKDKLRNACKRASYGAIIFEAITFVIAFTGLNLWMWVFNLVFVPAALLIHVLPLDSFLPAHFVHGYMFLIILSLIVNPLLGAMVFAFGKSFVKSVVNWKGFSFAKKGDDAS